MNQIIKIKQIEDQAKEKVKRARQEMTVNKRRGKKYWDDDGLLDQISADLLVAQGFIVYPHNKGYRVTWKGSGHNPLLSFLKTIFFGNDQ